MPKPYSLDLRERVVSYVEAGHSRRAAAAHFRVSPPFVINLMTAGEFREQFECAKCRAQRRIESRLQSLEDSSSRVSFLPSASDLGSMKATRSRFRVA